MSRLDLERVSKSYGPVRAVERVELSVPAGGRTAIVGPSGSGKTTLLRLIAGFEQPDSGRILLDGELMADGEAMVPAHRRHIGYLPQDGGLFPHLTVAGNISFGMDDKPARKMERVVELMRMVALDPALAARSPHQLSGGQQQRVALARALAQSPKLMLLDEPFSALDTGLRAATRKAVAELLAGIGATTILVTHDQDEALSFADQIAVIRDGRLAQVGAAMDLYLRPHDQATALFMGEAVLLPAQLDAGVADCALGRIQVDDVSHRGAARIMLRPEQIELGEAGTPCQVTEVEYGGPASQVTVRMPGEGEPRFLVVKSPSIRTPQVGDQVRLSVVGAAHRLDD